MLAMGLSLTIPQIMQPLKNIRLVFLALVANFVLVPALAYIMLMVVTVIYLPLVLPLLLQGVEVNAGEIAVSLVLMMLVPLAAGLLIKARYESTAASLYPHMSQTSSTTFMLMLGGLILLNVRNILGIIGGGALIAILIFMIVSFGIGFLLGGKQGNIRSVMGLGTGQRNVSAAVVVAGQNFSDDPNVLVFIIVAALIGLVLLMPIGGELGKRAQVAA